MPEGEGHRLSWQSPSKCIIGVLEKKEESKALGEQRCASMGEGLGFLECKRENCICMSLNETSLGSTSQPGSGSGVPSIQVLASKSPPWIFYFFSLFFLSSLPFWRALYYAGSLPCSRLPPTSPPSAIVSNQFRKQH